MPTISRYRRAVVGWNPEKFGGNTVIPTGRDSLVVGVHKPNSAANVGPYSFGNNWIDVFPTGGNNYIPITGPADDEGTGAYYRKRFWGQIRPSQGMTDWAVKFKQCWFVGPDPDSNLGTDPCFIVGHGANPSKIEIHDSLLDPEPWVTMQGASRISPYYYGMHGCNFRIYRSEIRNCQDGMNLVGPSGSNPTAVANQETLIQQCWIHKGYYSNNVYGPSDGQPHCDAIQFNTGKNYTIIGNYLGGNRVMRGDWTWPTGGAAPYLGEGYNAGDDFWNAAFMIKQEVDDSSTQRLEDILIEDNWIEGGERGINHFFEPSRPTNTFATTTIQNNKFVIRSGLDSANWGLAYRGNGPGTPSTTWPGHTGPGSYIIRSPSITATYSNNTLEGTSTLVPIAQGA